MSNDISASFDAFEFITIKVEERNLAGFHTFTLVFQKDKCIKVNIFINPTISVIHYLKMMSID